MGVIMNIDDYNNIKWVDNEEVVLTLEYDSPTNPTGKYNSQIWGTDKGNIQGNPQSKLFEKIKSLGAGEGDTLRIKKVNDKELFDYPFFEVEIVSTQTETQAPVTAESSAKPESGGSSLSKIMARFDKLEKKIDELLSQNEPF